MIKNRRLYQLFAIAKNNKQSSSTTQKMAAAVTATEMYFRPLPYRIIEYIYVALLIILGRDASSISLGISQISIRHYVSLESVNQFQAFRFSMSARENIATCCKLLDSNKWGSPEEVCKFYNGKSSPYYSMKLKQHYELIHEFEQKREV